MFSVTKNSVFKISALTLMSLATLSSAFAGGGDGGHFNGPTLAPISIPVNAEHGIKLEVAREAMQSCIRYDAKGKVTGLSQVLFRQAFGKELDMMTSEVLYDEGAKMVRFNIGKGYSESKKEVFLIQDVTYALACENCVYLAIGQFKDPYADDAQPIKYARLQAATTLPRLRFDSSIKDVSYDDWGSVSSTTYYLKGLRLEVPANYREDVPFINLGTGRPTALKVNLSDTVDCISRLIAEGAEK